MTAAAGALILYEWAAMTGPFATRAADKAAVVLVAVSVLCASFEPLTSVLILLAVAAAVALGSVIDAKLRWLALGILYAGIPGVAAVVLRGDGAPGEISTGFYAIVFVFVVVWATDSAAYFTGRSLGGPKLWPAVSPGKTWSGALGGLIAAVLVGILVAIADGFGALLMMGLVAAVLSVASQAGDLAESAMKRRFGVKDSGRIIPGHGGIMDRVDGLVAALVLAAAIGLVHSGGRDASAGLLVW
jgi:phosphatidate cytidylyltransferase